MRRFVPLCALALTVLLAACGAANVGQQNAGQAEPEALRIAFLGDLSGGLAEIGVEMRDGFLLAIEHVNEAGGVFGQPVEFLIGDTAANPAVAVEAARRLIEIEGAHAIVGAHSSDSSIAVAESVTGPAGIPQISPASSSPQLALAADNDFLFRATLNDTVLGPALARLVNDQGYTNVGLIYPDDAWGQGVARAFEQAFSEEFGGRLAAVAVTPLQAAYLSEVQQSLRNDPEALVMLAHAPEGAIILREAIENGLYDRFVFGPASRNPSLPEAIGAEHLAGMPGTAPGTAPGTESALLWEAAYIDRYERPYGFLDTKQTYDAVIAFALAAAAAQSTDGAAIRDQLRRIGAAPGQVVFADVGSIRLGLIAAAEGEDIDYEGAAQSLEWDENGDLDQGYVGVWRFTPEGRIEDAGVIPYGG